jgi:hypothetical protein
MTSRLFLFRRGIMRKKRELDRFAKYCFGSLGLPPIKIHYCPAKTLVDPQGNFCFACYTYGSASEIWTSYKLTKWNVMWNIAHEIWHYKQDCDGRIMDMTLEECENEAEKASEELVALWLIRGGKVTTDDR